MPNFDGPRQNTNESIGGQMLGKTADSPKDARDMPLSEAPLWLVMGRLLELTGRGEMMPKDDTITISYVPVHKYWKLEIHSPLKNALALWPS